MKSIIVAGVVALWSAPCLAQTADRSSLDGEARQFSALTAMQTACRDENAPLIKSALDAITQKAWQRYGKPAFDQALTTEIPRRRAELDATGQDDWCRYQRGYLRDLGLKDAFLH